MAAWGVEVVGKRMKARMFEWLWCSHTHGQTAGSISKLHFGYFLVLFANDFTSGHLFACLGVFPTFLKNCFHDVWDCALI